MICLEIPEFFGAIGFFYRNFSQVSDAEVSTILESMSAEDIPKGPCEGPLGLATRGIRTSFESRLS